MWEGIKESMRRRAARLHLGRTSLANEGLRRFKAGFGAREIPMAYRRYDFRMKAFVKDQDRAQTWVNRLFRAMPQPLLRLAGEALYPHLS